MENNEFETELAICAKSLAGRSIWDLAVLFYCTKGKIEKVLCKHNIPYGQKGKPPAPVVHEDLEQCYLRGIKVTDLVGEYQVSKDIVLDAVEIAKTMPIPKSRRTR